MSSTCPSCLRVVPAQATTCPTCHTPLTNQIGPAGTALSPGTSLKGGEYIIEKVLGQGGFGITYKAVKKNIRKSFAIKELFPTGSYRAPNGHIHPPQRDFPKLKQDFISEAELLKEVDSHRNIVDVIDYFEENGTAYVVMQYIEGEPLEDVIQRYPKGLPQEKALRYMKHIADALKRVHEKGILHRDIKPSNILIDTANDEANLIDFGAARTVSFYKTQQLTVVVTPTYAPPEQFLSEGNFKPALDIYSFGATFYHALTGRLPISGLDQLKKGIKNPSLRVARPDLHPALAEMIERCLSIEVEQRPQSADELLEVIEEVERSLRTKNQPMSNLPLQTNSPQSAASIPQSASPAPFISLPTSAGRSRAQQATQGNSSTPSAASSSSFKLPMWVVIVAGAIVILFIVLAELYEPKRRELPERRPRPSQRSLPSPRLNVFLYHADHNCISPVSCDRRVALV